MKKGGAAAKPQATVASGQPDELAVLNSEPNKGGRPRKLTPDAATLRILRGLGHIQATTRECAAFLEVSEPTFLKFKDDYPEVADALEVGKGRGKVSLRRTQFELAKRNAAMSIFLGKNHLGQSDRPDDDEIPEPKLGKKEAAKADAYAAVAEGGRFAPRRAPRLAVVGGKTVETE